MKILSMTNHRHSTPAILRNPEKSNAVDLQWQELFMCIRQTYKGPYWDIKRNGKELQCLPMTLAFIKAVKTMRMSGRSSPFTSHSSSGDNTPPATSQKVTACQKGHPAHFSHRERRAGSEMRLVGTQASQSLLRNRYRQAAHTMVRSFIACKGRNVTFGSDKGKETSRGANKKRLMFPTSISEVMWNHVSYEKLRFGSQGQKARRERHISTWQKLFHKTVLLYCRSQNGRYFINVTSDPYRVTKDLKCWLMYSSKAKRQWNKVS